MRKVGLDDLIGLARYATVRADRRRQIIELKRQRRVAVGDRITLVFENFETVLFQIQEMVFVEQITDIDRIREECEVYNALLPGNGDLSATLFVEITDQARIAEELNALVGIDEHVALLVGERRIGARFEPGRSRQDRISAVQYVRFPLDAEARCLLATAGTPVAVEIDHPRYRGSARLTEAQRASLAGDVAS